MHIPARDYCPILSLRHLVTLPLLSYNLTQRTRLQMRLTNPRSRPYMHIIITIKDISLSPAAGRSRTAPSILSTPTSHTPTPSCRLYR